MTREKFIQHLKDYEWDYSIMPDGTIEILESNPSMSITNTESLPGNLVFRNNGNIYFSNIYYFEGPVSFYNRGNVDLLNLQSLDVDGCVFENEGTLSLYRCKSISVNTTFNSQGDHAYIYFNDLKSMCESLTFTNSGNLDLGRIKEIPRGTVFANGGEVRAESVEISKIDPTVKFMNLGSVHLDGIATDDWDLDVDGISGNRILPLVAKGLF